MSADILIVSPDDHLVEPSDLWTSRLPARYRDAGPRIVRHRGRMDPTVTTDVAFIEDENGRDADIWHYEDAIIPIPLISAAAGYEIDELTTDPITYDEMRPGCYRAADRLADMDIAGIEASACFPNTLVRFCGQRFLYGKDKELALLCVQAYNDFQIDEWAAGSDGRLIRWGSSRCGTSNSPRRKSNEWRRKACAPCASRSCRRASTCLRSTADTGTRSSPPASATRSASCCTSGRARR